MITTKRASGFAIAGSGATDLLERRSAQSFNDSVNEGTTVADGDLEEAKARMQKNLDRILNYDKYYEEEAIEENAAKNVVEATVVEETEIVDETRVESASEEDINPTSTTMQFGDADNAQVFNDMARQKEEQSESYRLNAKGKLVVALYAVAVALILTLIVLNTGVLAMLSKSQQETAAALSTSVSEYNAVVAEIDTVSSDENVIETAEKKFGMIKK